MTSLTHSLYTRIRLQVGTIAIVALTTVCLVANPGTADAQERATPVIGSLAVGGGITAGIDERTGAFTAQVPLVELPGVGGVGAVSLGVTYSHDLAAANSAPDKLGAWTWGVPRVEVDAGVRVVTPSGSVYTAADESSDPNEVSSGLEQYVQGDLVFTQTPGILDSLDTGAAGIPFAYSLEHLGGITDYFSAAGDIVARTDAFDFRTYWTWGDGHQLLGVTDGAGSEVTINWTDEGVEIISPPRNDGVVAKTVLGIEDNTLLSMTNPVGERVGFEYDMSGKLKRVAAASGAETHITYQPLPNNHLNNNAMTVDSVRVVDSDTGAELSKRSWKIIGDHNPQGSPKYSSPSEMWGSSDQEYQYQTDITDGNTHMVSQYNSMGLMLSRQVVLSTTHGQIHAEEQQFTYQGTENGGVPPQHNVPEQYAKPITAHVVYRDSNGATRQVTERREFDTTGRVTKHIAADETTTTTEYNSVKAQGKKLPIGLLAKQTTKGHDGTVAETINTLTADNKAIQATETYVTSPGGSAQQTSRTEFTVDNDGFVAEKKIIAVQPQADGPTEIVTQFSRTVNADAKTLTVSQTDAAGTTAQSTTSTVLDLVTGLTVSATDSVERVTSSRYDAAGRILVHTTPGNRHTTTVYEKRTTRVTDPLGVTQSTYVNVLGQVIAVTDNLRATADTIRPVDGWERTIETRTYDDNASTVTVTDARGLETITVADVWGRPTSVKGPTGAMQIHEYDDIKKTVRSGVVPPSGSGLQDALHTTVTQMDDSNREIGATGTRKDDIRVPEQTTKYDGLGRVTDHTSADISTNVVMNADGTPRTTTNTPARPETFPGETVTANREHDVLGASTNKTLTRSDGQSRQGISRVLDAAGRTSSETNQAGQTVEYDYTVDGLVAEIRNVATGVTTRNTYDPTTRALTQTEKVAADVTTRTQFEHDAVTGEILAACDPADCDGTRIRSAYNIFGNVTNITYPDGKTVHHTFDEHGRKTSSTDIDGNTTEYTYDRIGLLERATQSNAGNLIGRVDYTYDQYGRTTKVSRDNGVTTQYTFTSLNEILTETTTHGQTKILDASYTYDSHGNLTQRVDTRPEETDTAKLLTETTTYAYNAYNQLVESIVYPGNTTETPNGHAIAPSLTTTYTIGVSGEVTAETTTTLETTTTREFEYNPLGQTTAITTTHNGEATGTRAEQKYDQAGNLTHAADGTNYTYNIHNQPVKEIHPNNGTIVENSYWVTGKRQKIATTHKQANEPNTSATITPLTSPTPATDKLNTETVTMHWDGTTLINETHTTNTNPPTVASYLIGTTRHARNVATANPNEHITPTTHHYVTDRHGNITATTTTTGQITEAYTYSDYGDTTTHTAPELTNTAAQRNPFQYGNEYTTVAGPQLLGKRTYDSKVFGFNTRDDADQFNLYAYANSNPITFVDPTGQTPTRDTIINAVGIGVGIVSLFFIGAAIGFAAVTSAWVAVGFGIAAAVVETAATTISAAELIDDHADGYNFINDKDSEALTWAGLGLAIAGGVLGLGAGIGSAIKMLRTPQKVAMDAIRSGTWAKGGDEWAQTVRKELFKEDQFRQIREVDDHIKAGRFDKPMYKTLTGVDATQRMAGAANENAIRLTINVNDPYLHLLEQATAYRGKLGAINKYHLDKSKAPPFGLLREAAALDDGLAGIMEYAFRKLSRRTIKEDFQWTLVYDSNGILRFNNELLRGSAVGGPDWLNAFTGAL